MHTLFSSQPLQVYLSFVRMLQHVWPVYLPSLWSDLTFLLAWLFLRSHLIINELRIWSFWSTGDQTKWWWDFLLPSHCLLTKITMSMNYFLHVLEWKRQESGGQRVLVLFKAIARKSGPFWSRHLALMDEGEILFSFSKLVWHNTIKVSGVQSNNFLIVSLYALSSIIEYLSYMQCMCKNRSKIDHKKWEGMRVCRCIYTHTFTSFQINQTDSNLLAIALG